MSLSLLAASTLPSSSFSNPLHWKTRNLSTITVSKTISYTSCEQKENKDADNHKQTIDRRNVLLGIGGGLYGASAMGIKSRIAVAAPRASEIPKLAAETVSKKKQSVVDSVKNFFGMKKDEGTTETPLPQTVPSEIPKIKKEYAQVSADLEVDLPASEIWAVYSSPDLPRLIVELLPARFEKIDVLQGNGGEGTVVHCVLKSGNSGPREWNEKIVKIDDKTRTKVVRQIEGGYLDVGFCHYEHIFTITEKDANSCTIRMTASFGVDEKFEANAKMITPNWGMGKAIANYVVQSKAKKT